MSTDSAIHRFDNFQLLKSHTSRNWIEDKPIFGSRSSVLSCRFSLRPTHWCQVDRRWAEDSSEVESLASGTTSDQQTVTDEKLKGGRFSRIAGGFLVMSCWLNNNHGKIPQRDVDFASKIWTSVMVILTDKDFSEDWITTYCNSNFWCLSCYSSGCKLCVVRKTAIPSFPHLVTGGRHFMKLMGSKAGTKSPGHVWGQQGTKPWEQRLQIARWRTCWSQQAACCSMDSMGCQVMGLSFAKWTIGVMTMWPD